MQKAILTDMVINSGIQYYPNFENPTYCIFILSSAVPDKRGKYFKAECRAAYRVCDEVKRLKLHEKSYVDVIGTIIQYEKKQPDGSLRDITAYDLVDITICEHQFSKSDAKEKETEKESVPGEKKRNDYLHKLLTDPFIKKEDKK